MWTWKAKLNKHNISWFSNQIMLVSSRSKEGITFIMAWGFFNLWNQGTPLQQSILICHKNGNTKANDHISFTNVHVHSTYIQLVNVNEIMQSWCFFSSYAQQPWNFVHECSCCLQNFNKNFGLHYKYNGWPKLYQKQWYMNRLFRILMKLLFLILRTFS
jgi:hypothetical protein